ncbi:hypothetical protein P2318_02050 [Myxococcaceae bacterium GXIMD 01537]
MAPSLLLFTRADVGGRSVFRPVPLDLELRPGTGRLWVDLSRGNAYAEDWQRHAQHLGVVGRRAYALPWDETDLLISPRYRGLKLDGRSASLPLFVAWVALLSGRALPAPFLATGVVLEGQEAIAPAPREYLQGKLDVADSYVRQMHPGAERVPMWVPQGSAWDGEPLRALDVRPVPDLVTAVERILGLASRAGGGGGGAS